MLRILLYFLLLINTTFCLAKTEKAIFAGGCFWCMEADFDHLPGVLSTTSGFDGGTLKDQLMNKFLPVIPITPNR